MRSVDRISDLTSHLLASLIFVTGATLLLDAATRNVLSIPIHRAIGFAQFTLAAHYFPGGPIPLEKGEHMRMDLWYASLSDRGRAQLDLFTVWCMIFYPGVMPVGSISSLQGAIRTAGRRFSRRPPPVIPIKSLLTACLVLMLLPAFALVFKHIATPRRKSGNGKRRHHPLGDRLFHDRALRL